MTSFLFKTFNLHPYSLSTHCYQQYYHQISQPLKRNSILIPDWQHLRASANEEKSLHFHVFRISSHDQYSLLDKRIEQTAPCTLLVVSPGHKQFISWSQDTQTNLAKTSLGGQFCHQPVFLPVFNVNIWFCLPKESIRSCSELPRGKGNAVQQLCVNGMFRWSINTGAAHFVLFPGLQNKIEVKRIILKKSSAKLTIKLV